MISKKSIEIRYAETDQMGVVYHANYLVWFDLARTKFFQDAGFDHAQIEKDGIMFPVHNIDITYKSPCRYGETVSVFTSIEKFNDYTTIYKHVIKGSDDSVRAIGKSTMAHCDKSTFKLIKASKLLPNVYAKYKEFLNNK